MGLGGLQIHEVPSPLLGLACVSPNPKPFKPPRKDAEVEANELERDAEDVDSVLSPDSL